MERKTRRSASVAPTAGKTGKEQIDSIFDKLGVSTLHAPSALLHVPGTFFLSPADNKPKLSVGDPIRPMDKRTPDALNLIAMQARLDTAVGRVPKLALDGANFQAWAVMLEYALTAATGRERILTSRDQLLSATEEIIVKHGILATVDESLQVGVIQALSATAAYNYVSKCFSINSRSNHVRIVREMLSAKFDLRDQGADIDAHFCRIEGLGRSLFCSGFHLNKESFIGMLFHLSLPGINTYPFVNICRQVDVQPKPSGNVSNLELLRLAKVELMHYWQNRKLQEERPRRQTKKDKGAEPARKTRTCYMCKQPGHWKGECPNRGSGRSGRGGPGQQKAIMANSIKVEGNKENVTAQKVELRAEAVDEEDIGWLSRRGEEITIGVDFH